VVVLKVANYPFPNSWNFCGNKKEECLKRLLDIKVNDGIEGEGYFYSIVI
jgi:hypothetical protein